MINRLFECEVHSDRVKELYAFFAQRVNEKIGDEGRYATCDQHKKKDGFCLVIYTFPVGFLSRFSVNYHATGEIGILDVEKIIEPVRTDATTINEDVITMAIDMVEAGIKEHYKEFIRGED